MLTALSLPFMKARRPHIEINTFPRECIGMVVVPRHVVGGRLRHVDRYAKLAGRIVWQSFYRRNLRERFGALKLLNPNLGGCSQGDAVVFARS